jgi:uncharacterized protein (DUF1015 family)
MPDIQAFRAFRYDLGRAGALSDLVAPPFDTISPELQTQLEAKSPYNVVNIDLGRDEPGDDANRNRYTRSANRLRDWIQSGVVKQDTARGLYVYHQQYTLDGTAHTRRGFFARIRLQPFGEGTVYPHELTFKGPKEDRLKLMRATGMNLSSVFGMYPDPDGSVQRKLDSAIERALPLEAIDHLGTISRLWPVTDSALVSEITGLMGPKPLVIADGHHRYETACHYLAERRAAGDVPNAEAAPNFALMLFVATSDPGLLVHPTHRLLSGLGGLTADDVRKLLGSHFEVEPAASAEEAWQNIELDGSQSILAFGTAADQRWLVARFVKPEVMDELAADHSATWRGLGVSILHKLVIEKLIGREPQTKFVHRTEEAADAVKNRTCDLAVLVPACSVAETEKIAVEGETMPQKSTYFYPKILTGMVFNSLKGH